MAYMSWLFSINQTIHFSQKAMSTVIYLKQKIVYYFYPIHEYNNNQTSFV